MRLNVLQILLSRFTAPGFRAAGQEPASDLPGPQRLRGIKPAGNC